jgi:hypothetical protein
MYTIPMRAVNRHTGQETRYNLNSPLLFGVLQALDPETRVDILDLAPANANMLDYFAQSHCKLHLPACRDELLTLRLTEDEVEPPLSRVFETCLPLPDSDNNPLDLLLLWDLPNYLDKQVLSALITYLAPYTGKRTVLHTYIHTRQSMPAQPGDYRLTLEKNVLVDMPAAWTATSPMYYQELLHKILAPFRVERGMLLANGLQEYILRTK